MVIAIPPIKTPFPSIMPRPLPRPFRIDPSCVFYWDGVDKLSQRKVLDESGKNNHGAITGAIFVPNGLFFNGTTDFVTLPQIDYLNTEDFTINAWIESTATFGANTSMMIINNGIGANGSLAFFYRWRNTDGTYRIGVNARDDSANVTSVITNIGETYVSNNGAMITLRRDNASNTMKLYYNGIEVKSGVDNSADDFTRPVGQVVGKNQAANDLHFGGIIYELQIWKRALSPDELVRFHNLTKIKYL